MEFSNLPSCLLLILLMLMVLGILFLMKSAYDTFLKCEFLWFRMVIDWFMDTLSAACIDILIWYCTTHYLFRDLRYNDDT